MPPVLHGVADVAAHSKQPCAGPVCLSLCTVPLFLRDHPSRPSTQSCTNTAINITATSQQHHMTGHKVIAVIAIAIIRGTGAHVGSRFS